MYGSESCVLIDKLLSKLLQIILRTCEIKIQSIIECVTDIDKIISKEIRNRLNINRMFTKIETQKLR